MVCNSLIFKLFRLGTRLRFRLKFRNIVKEKSILYFVRLYSVLVPIFHNLWRKINYLVPNIIFHVVYKASLFKFQVQWGPTIKPRLSSECIIWGFSLFLVCYPTHILSLYNNTNLPVNEIKNRGTIITCWTYILIY